MSPWFSGGHLMPYGIDIWAIWATWLPAESQGSSFFFPSLLPGTSRGVGGYCHAGVAGCGKPHALSLPLPRLGIIPISPLSGTRHVTWPFDILYHTAYWHLLISSLPRYLSIYRNTCRCIRTQNHMPYSILGALQTPLVLPSLVQTVKRCDVRRIAPSLPLTPPP
jgi:hypothetical protein